MIDSIRIAVFGVKKRRIIAKQTCRCREERAHDLNSKEKRCFGLDDRYHE